MGKIDERTEYDKSDFRNSVPRFNPGNRKANQSLVGLLGQTAQGTSGLTKLPCRATGTRRPSSR